MLFIRFAIIFGICDSYRTLNRRNHRKLLIVDDRIGYFGGMNLVDQRGLATPNDTKARHLPASAGWRDLHVRLVGPKQAEIAREMERLWQWKTRQPITVPATWPLAEMLGTHSDDIQFFGSRPSRQNRRIGRVIGPLIRRAEREIIVSMAYFIPIGTPVVVVNYLGSAATRGAGARRRAGQKRCEARAMGDAASLPAAAGPGDTRLRAKGFHASQQGDRYRRRAHRHRLGESRSAQLANESRIRRGNLLSRPGHSRNAFLSARNCPQSPGPTLGDPQPSLVAAPPRSTCLVAPALAVKDNRQESGMAQGLERQSPISLI